MLSSIEGNKEQAWNRVKELEETLTFKEQELTERCNE